MKVKSRGTATGKPLPGFNHYEVKREDGSWAFELQDDWIYTPLNGAIATIKYDDTKRTGTRRTTRYCDHTVCEIHGQSFTTLAYTDAARNRRCTQKSGSFGDVIPLTVPTDLASVHAEALRFFESGCQEREFDLGINIVEWRETLNLFKGLKLLAQGAKNFLSTRSKMRFLHQLALQTKKNVSELTLKDVANTHLAYEFGFKPLIKDIEGAWNTLAGFQESFAWLRKNQGKPVKVRFAKDLSKVYAPSATTQDYGWEKFHTSVRLYSCWYKAYAVIQYDISRLNDAELALRLLARKAGVDSVLRNGWELIPYSFVLDWVLDVGEWIERFDPRVTLPYQFIDVGWSIRVVEVLERWKSYAYPITQHFTVYGGTRKTLYHREPGLPVSFSSIDTGNPGQKQLALGLSLLAQKLHK